MSEQYRQGGIRRLVITIDARARRPGSSLYLVTTFTGQPLAGNVTALQPGILDKPGWTETIYRRLDEAERRRPTHPEHHALVRVFQLPGGFRLLVGRDLEERERLYRIVLAAGRWSVAIVLVLGLAGGLFVSRRVLRRVDAMTETTRTIMEGDLGERLPVAGTGDEIDRLAENLNQMLERIESLMRGLKEVSDNIAHDLKTPLTRLRNRAEQALRTAKTDDEYRAALEATIDESDALITTFNALLMIARAESGQARDDMVDFDAAEIVHDVGELYEPLAEEKGIALKVEAADAGAGQGQPRTGQPGARQPDRQRHQICRAADGARGAGGNRGERHRCRRAHPADRRRPRAGHPGSRPRAGGGALRAAGAEPLAAGLRPGPEPGRGGGAAARRRADAGRQ